MSNTVYLNGQFLPESEAKVSVFDRSFLYGDGFFETVRIHKGRPVFWPLHMSRMKSGATLYGYQFPVDWMELGFLAMELAKRNKIETGVLRVHLSRGVGVRGYSPKGATKPTLLMTVAPLKQQGFHHSPIETMVSERVYLPLGDAITGFKSASKLPQIIGSWEAAENGLGDCILLNSGGRIAECGSGNIFIRVGKKLITPSPAEGPVVGILRTVLLNYCRLARIPFLETKISLAKLLAADEVFRTSSIGGITPITKIHCGGTETSFELTAIVDLSVVIGLSIAEDSETPW